LIRLQPYEKKNAKELPIPELAVTVKKGQKKRPQKKDKKNDRKKRTKKTTAQMLEVPVFRSLAMTAEYSCSLHGIARW
jgi:hypothetical protein